MKTSSAVWQHRTSAPDGVDTAAGPYRSDPAGDADGTGIAGRRTGGDDAATVPAPRRDREDLWLGRSVVALCAVALVAVVYVLHAALPAAPFTLPLDNRQAVRSVIPEGWGFFTLSPRTPDVIAYGARAGGNWHRLTVGGHDGTASLLGLNRRGRSQGTEIGIVVKQIPPTAWAACDREPVDCLSGLAPRPRTVVNFSTHHSVCGDVGLVAQDVLPWAWRDLPTVMPSKVVRVVVSC